MSDNKQGARPDPKVYKRVREPKTEEVEAEKPKSEENHVRVVASRGQRMYIKYAMEVFAGTEGKTKADQVVLTGMGNAVYNVVNVVEILKRRVVGLHQTTDVSSEIMTDKYEAIEEGKDGLEIERRVSTIKVVLSTSELDKNHPGYQAPLPESEITDEDLEEPKERRPRKKQAEAKKGDRKPRGEKKDGDRKPRGEKKDGDKKEGDRRREGGARRREGGDRREGAARREGGDRREGAARREGGDRREGGARREGGDRREGGARREGGDRRRDERRDDDRAPARGGRGGRRDDRDDRAPARGGRGGAPRRDDRDERRNDDRRAPRRDDRDERRNDDRRAPRRDDRDERRNDDRRGDRRDDRDDRAPARGGRGGRGGYSEGRREGGRGEGRSDRGGRN